MNKRIWILIGLFGAIAGLPSGCNKAEGPETITAQFKLERFKNCDDLLTYFKQEAIRVMDEQVDYEIGWADDYDSGGVSKGGGVEPAYDGQNSSSSETGGNTPTDASGDTTGPEHSDTNIQEKGVDEADIVKTDGKYLYIVSGAFFLVVKAWPPEETWEIGRLRIPDGQPREMFIYNDLAVVFSDVWDYEMADSNWSQSPPSARYGVFSKVSFIDLSDKSKPAFIRQLYLEGQYVTSRMVKGTVRFVLASSLDGPSYNTYVDNSKYWNYQSGDFDVSGFKSAMEDLRKDNRAVIESSKLEDWMPLYYELGDAGKKSGAVSECSDFYRPTEYSGNSVLSVLTFNLDNPLKKETDVSIVSNQGVVYASTDALYLTTTPNWGAMGDTMAYAGGGNGDTPVSTDSASAPAADSGSSGTKSRVETREMGLTSEEAESCAIHKFDIASSGREAIYVASGRIYGTVLNQFSLSEDKGYLRVGTTTDGWATGEGTSNHLFVLKQSGGELKTVGRIDGLASGERIYAMRFMGNRGFMVTYHQMDPLYTFDLSNPAKPVKVGELHIPGYSAYLHPLGEDHLIGVGRDTKSVEGMVQTGGVKVSLFDVSDFDHPTETAKETFGDSWEVDSEVLYDHHAFLYYEPLEIMALPFNSTYGSDGFQGVKVFHVTPENGFEAIGEVDHSGFYVDQYDTYYEYRVLRTLVIEHYLYSISQLGLKVNDIEDLTRDVATVNLPGVYGGTYDDEPPAPPPETDGGEGDGSPDGNDGGSDMDGGTKDV